MATYENSENISGIAGTDVTIYRLVSLAADGEYDHTGAAGRPDGVCAETVAAGGTFPLATKAGSVVKLEASAAIAVGAEVVAAAAGKCATQGGTDPRVGKARTAAAADGDIIEVILDID